MGVPAASVTYARLLALIAEAGGVTVSATAPTDPETGNLWYDTTYQLLKIYDGGDWHTTSDHVLVEVRNNSGSDITKGQPLFVSGTHNSGKPNVTLAANSNGNMPAIGLADTDIADGEEGYAIISGVLEGVNTSAFSTGDALYVDSTPGVLTSTRPVEDNEEVQKVALVTRSHQQAGSLIVMGAGRVNDVPNGLINDSVILDSVTNSGSTNSVVLQHGGRALGENAVGIPVDRSCKTTSAVVTWRAGVAPTGTWTLTLKKKPNGSRNYTTTATMSVTVNNG